MRTDWELRRGWQKIRDHIADDEPVNYTGLERRLVERP